MAKYSVLTFVFNDYDFIREPLELSNDCEYILVTDNKDIKSTKWNIKYLPKEYENASGFTKSFYVRYHPFEFVSTDVCIVLDGSNQIKKPLDKLVNDFLSLLLEFFCIYLKSAFALMLLMHPLNQVHLKLFEVFLL